ncbi:hypothetical protein L2E82_30980 [Cichorium intybus]|uniref:Uncharacterized protein n=1 Tax=Cichorium intybus TaxID=13427 RepID=A0ACB9D1Z5_CICIN|nr:hypothetical protein L2E82_30980 [Cichorium intybus]
MVHRSDGYGFIDEGILRYFSCRNEINKRGETMDGYIKRLDGELAQYKDQVKKTQVRIPQEDVKARAMSNEILQKKKRM